MGCRLEVADMAAASIADPGTGRKRMVKALMLLGGILLVAEVALFSWHVEQYWDRAGAQAVGAFSAVGMAAVHLVNTVAWNPGAALAGSVQVLVLCWPLLLVAAGIVLLRKSASR